MSKKDELTDLRRQMKILQKEKEQKQQESRSESQDMTTLERLSTTITPIVNAFVETDTFLNLQSRQSHSVYISYANLRLFGLLISAPHRDLIELQGVKDSVETVIYTGPFKEKEIQSAVKQALLDWYRGL